VGDIGDEDLSNLISVTVRVPKGDLVVIDELIQYIPAGYNGMRSKFFRHALRHLLLSWRESEQIEDTGLAGRLREVVEHAELARETSVRVAIRQNYEETLRTHEASLREGLDTGDWQLILRALRLIDHQIKTTPDPHWQSFVQHVVAKSPLVRLAVSKLYDMLPEEMEVKYWQMWLEALSS